MINEYVRDCKIGTGSYGKVVSKSHSIVLFQAVEGLVIVASSSFGCDVFPSVT